MLHKLLLHGAAGGGIGPPAEAAWLLLYTMHFEIGLVTKLLMGEGDNNTDGHTHTHTHTRQPL